MCIVSGAIFLFAGLKVDEVFCPQRDGLWLQRQKQRDERTHREEGTSSEPMRIQDQPLRHLNPGEPTEVINGSESKVLVVRMCLC